MRASTEAGIHASVWDGANADTPVGRGHVARATRHFIAAGVEDGHLCPITMTHASVAALAAAPERLRDWLPLISSRHYDARFLPFWEKKGVTLGMGMTLSLADFAEIARRPRSFLVGLAGHLFVVPWIAVLLNWLCGLEAGIAIGLILAATRGISWMPAERSAICATSASAPGPSTDRT